jgi:hypothetical protein
LQEKDDRMTSDGFALASVVILLLPMVYFFMTSPTFLLVTLDNPSVTLVLRALFNAYFLMISIFGGIGTLAFIVAGRPVVTIGMGMIAALAIWARGWFLHEIDTQVSAYRAGDGNALHRLRRVHLGGMAYNAVLLAAIAGSYALVRAV